MMFSVVTTLYRSSPYIDEFYNRISASLQQITDNYEIIFVNDGSPDNSLEVVLSILQKDERVKVVDLSRNFGHHKAMMTGLFYAKGDYVLMIDTDLEEKPELLLSYWDVLKKQNDVDVVYGIQEQRGGSFMKQFFGKLFYHLLNYMSSENMPTNISFSRLMTKRYVKTLIKFKEREMYIGGLWHIAGYKQISIPIHKSFKGISSYTLNKKLIMVTNAVTSFSNKPLIMIFYLGLIISFFSTLYGFYLIVDKFLFGGIMSGWTSMMVSIWFLSGIIILCLGVTAIYLSKIFIEVKNRPYTIVRHVYKKNQEMINN